MARLNSSIHKSLTDSVIKDLVCKGIFTDYDFIQKDTDFLIKITGLSFKVFFEVIFSNLFSFHDIVNIRTS